MKHFLILLLPLSLLSVNLRAMQRNMMCRTYSMNPAVDSLKTALMDDDTEAMEERLGRCLPQALDRQYVLLGLNMSEEARQRLLNKIGEYWYRRIQLHPTAGLDDLFSGLKTLKTSYGLENLGYSFKWLLTRLKRKVLQCRKVKRSKKLTEQAQKIPAYDAAPRLQSILGHLVATMVRQDDLEGLPEECLALTYKAKPIIHVDLPFTR